MEIRYICKTDSRKEISRIYEESWKCAYKGIIPQSYLDSIPEGRWAEKLDNPEWNTLVCTVDGKIIGTSSFCKSRFRQYEGFGEIISIYFLPEYIGKGYGAKLLEYAVSELEKLGYNKIFLWVLEDNTRAVNFYERFGFIRTTDILNDNIGGKSLNEICYIYRSPKSFQGTSKNPF